MSKITVVDTIMGGGKTTWAIDYMNQNLDENILYISPFLDQDDRIAEACSEFREFQKPKNTGNGKLYSINELLLGQADIASTHELFKHLDDESRERIKEAKYVLVLDEVLDVVQNYKTQKNDIEMLLESGCITIDDDGFVHWDRNKKDYDCRYNDIRELAESHCLMCVNGSVLIWRYPPEIFGLFEKVYVLTYLFEASILKSYFDMYGISYKKKSVRMVADRKYELCDFYYPDTTKYAELINLHQGKINESWKQKPSALSLNWFKSSSSKDHIKQLQKNIYNYFQNIVKAKKETILWTTFKDFESKLQGKGYTRRNFSKKNGCATKERDCFLACNCRATNDYAERYNLVYAVNIYVNPEVLHFFNQRGVEVDVEMYALAEMLQWIWRSRIRNNEPINIYVPSKRMRELLTRWLRGEHLAERSEVA